MTTWSFVREAAFSTGDTWVKVTGDGASGTLTDIRVPDGARRISRIGVSVGAGSTAGNATFLLRVTGTGSAKGAQTLSVGGASTVGTSTALSMTNISLDVDIAVQPGIIELWWLTTTALGTSRVGIEITMDDKDSSGAVYVTREARLSTANVWTLVNAVGGVSEANIVAPGQRIVQVIGSLAAGATAGASAYLVRVEGLSGALTGNQHDFALGSTVFGGGTLATSAILRPVTKTVDIPCKEGGELRILASMAGASSGQPEFGVTLVIV